MRIRIRIRIRIHNTVFDGQFSLIHQINFSILYQIIGMQEATTNVCSVTSHLLMNIYLYLFAPEVYHNAPVIQIIHKLPE
jgi:hypothetical protein